MVILYCQEAGIDAMLIVLTSASTPNLVKIKKVNLDENVVEENNAISGSFVRITWDWQLIRFSGGCRFS